MKKYNYFHVATPTAVENFSVYDDAVSFYNERNESATLYGVIEHSAGGDDYEMIKAKWPNVFAHI